MTLDRIMKETDDYFNKWGASFKIGLGLTWNTVLAKVVIDAIIHYNHACERYYSLVKKFDYETIEKFNHYVNNAVDSSSGFSLWFLTGVLSTAVLASGIYDLVKK